MRGKYENRNALSSEMQPASELDDIDSVTCEMVRMVSSYGDQSTTRE